MIETTGFIQRLKWDAGGGTLYADIGLDPANTEVVTVVQRAGNSDSTISGKRHLMRLLTHAQLRGMLVTVMHPDVGSEVFSAATAVCDVTENPVQLDGIEVTQAVQDMSQSVPLVAGKRTVVRVYMSTYSAPSVTVRGQLSLRRSPSDAPITLDSLNTAVLDPTQAGDLPVKRADVSRSLNFLVPDTHTVAGPLAIRVASIADAGTGAGINFGCERRPIVRFHAGPSLRVRILGMRYRKGNPPVTYVPSNLDFALLQSWLRRAYPVDQVIWSQTVVDANAAPDFKCDDINAQLRAIRALDMSAGGDNRTHYYGMVSDGGFFMRGCADVPVAAPDPTAVGSGPTGPGTYGWDFDGSYGDWYGGHEIGHTFGRQHPGYCNQTQEDLPNYPYENGQLAASPGGFVGFDVGDPAQNLPMLALPGTTWHDVMTYCNFEWLSAYTYNGIRDRLLAEGN